MLNILKMKMRSKKGQGVMEYVILSSLIGIFCLVAVREFGSVVQKRIDFMKSEIVTNIRLK